MKKHVSIKHAEAYILNTTLKTHLVCGLASLRSTSHETMSTVVECIRCLCGCNELSKERLQELLNKKIKTFLQDQAAVEMFERFIPRDSRTHSYIPIVKQAEAFLDADIDTSSDEWEEFLEDLEEKLADELNENPDTKEALEKVIFHYTKKIETSKDYENFTNNLIEKYKKKSNRRYTSA